MTERPKCDRCGGPLDIFLDPECGLVWSCNTRPNPPAQTDAEFWARWESLPRAEQERQFESLVASAEVRRRSGRN